MKKQLEMSRTVKRILSQVFSLALAMVLVFPVVAPVSAATGYDANAAIAYAKKHWNDEKGLCAEFVSDCINAGGCPVWFYGCTTLVRMLEKSGYGTFYKLDVDSQGRISVSGNRDKLSIGDPVFYYCAEETDGCPYVHVVLYSGEDSNGYLKAYAHNRAKNNEVLYYSNCGYCGAKISTAYVYNMGEQKASKSIQEALAEIEVKYPHGSRFISNGKCLGYAKYVWDSVFGLDATEASNRIEVGAGRAGVVDTWKNAKPGDLIYFYDDESLSGSSWRHAGIYLGKNGNTISLVDCNYKGANKIAYYSVTCGQGGWPYSYVRVYRAKNYQTLDVQHTITFDAEGGSVYPTSITVPEGSNNWDLPTPTRNGYTFKGWCLGEVGTVNTIVAYPWTITGDMDLHAIWEKDGCASHNKDSYKTVKQNGKYTAVCKTCDEEFVLGSLDTSVKGTYKPASGYVTLCSAPYQDADVKQTRGEVQVVGAVTNAYDYVWYKTSDGYWILGKYLKEVEPEEFCVYFDANGGSVSTKNKMVTNGETYGALPTPTLSGYRFIGWYTGTDGGKRITSDMTVELYDELFVYARWEKEEEKCTSHTKGGYQFFEAAHPHYYYYECANCGEAFTDGKTREVDSCTTCNPPKAKPVSWGEWSSWSTNKVTETATRQVETRQVKVSNAYTEYRYGRYVSNGHDCWCKTYLASRPYSSGSISTD